jgi:4-amino-4-deoxy-L-arabinose transferase-like glycosyltransferase
MDEAGWRVRASTIATLAVIAAASLALGLWNNDFPLGYHPDEVKKVGFITTGTQDFHLPILLLQLTRAANAIARLDGGQEIVELGRAVSAVAGACIVVLAFLLARQILPPLGSLVVAALTAVSPILVVHAHYLKEDVVFTACALAALLALCGFVATPIFRRAVLLGVSLGLAVAAKYAGALLLVVVLVAPLVRRSTPIRGFYLRLLPAVLCAVVTFCAVNLPLFSDLGVFRGGLAFEMAHAVEGHEGMRIPGWRCFFVFHVLHSIVPGMTWPVALLGLAGIALTVAGWEASPWRQRLMVVYVAILYLAVELSPLKALPDSMRYVIPVVPVLCVLGFAVISQLGARVRGRGRWWAVGALAGAALIVSAREALLLTHHLTRDTREAAVAEVERTGLSAVPERFTPLPHRVHSLAALDVEEERARGTALLVANSLMYERYRLAVSYGAPSPWVRRRVERYEELFRYPYVEIRPRYKTFAFSNPTIRIIDIRRQR